MNAQPLSLAAVMTFAAVPAAAVVLGGVAAAVRTPGPRVQSAVQHIAAGVLFAALATELLPDVVHRRLPWVTLGGFALGVIAMLLLKALARRLEAREEETSSPLALPISLLLASALDIALDGLLIGVSFAAGERQGLLITIAMTLEVLFLGVATAAAMRGPKARSQVLATTITFAVLLMAGAGIGAYFLASASPPVLDGVLSFGVAALLYLVTEELLTEAHEVDETPLLTSMFFVGFPRAHWPQIYSTNPLERLNAEIKRRTNVVGIFPNDASITRLVGAMMLEQNDEWSLNRRYMQLEGLQTLSDTVPTRLSAVAR